MDGLTHKFGLHDSIGHHVSRAARLIERRVDEGLRQFGLTRVGWCILLAVEEEGKRNPSDIASFVGIDRTATSRALRQLEAEGLIAREMGREDRRTTEVTLTPAGRDIVQRTLPLSRQVMSQFHEKLAPSELSELKRLLAQLTSGEAP